MDNAKYSVSIARLAEFAGQYPLEEKVLFVPSFQVGRQYLARLALSGTSWLGFRLATAFSLARDAVEDELAENGIAIIGSVRVRLAIEKILERLDEGGALAYFNNSRELPGIAEAVYRAVTSLREVGVGSKDVTQSVFRERAKGGDIRLVLSEYEKFLKEENVIDIPGMLALALKKESAFERFKTSRFAVFAEFPLSGLQLELVKRASGGDFTVISHDPVCGLKRPRGYYPLESPDAPAPFSYLFQPEKAPEIRPDSIEYFAAVGSANEVREVFRRILENNIPFDGVEIVTPDPAEYVPAIMRIAENTGIPLTFGTGIPMSATSPGRALRAFLDWIESGFSPNALRTSQQSGAIVLDVEVDKTAEFLRPVRAPFESGKAGAAPRDGISLAALAGVCREVVTGGCDIRNETDRWARGELASRLDELAEASDVEVLYGEMRDRIIMFTHDINVRKEEPAPGKVHVSSLPRGGRGGRENTFFVGMDGQRFPGRGLQDPVLLDRDRPNLSGDLPTTLDRVTGNIYAFAVTFAGLRGKVVLSYPAWDPLEARANAPSSVILQAYRLATGNHEADYSALQEELTESMAGYCPAEDVPALDSADIWLSRLAENNRLRPAMPSVKKVYPFLAAGISAQRARESGRLTEFDGQLIEPCGEHDPCSKSGPKLSASRIEELAACPKKYFFKYVLELKPLEEDAPEPGVWLESMVQGNLLHEVFRRFMQSLRERGKGAVAESDRKLLHKILDEVAAGHAEDCPPPGEVVRKMEIEDLKRTAEVFLKMEIEKGAEVEPLYFEVGFGMPFEKGKDVEEIATPEPVKIRLEDVGSFDLRGRIDRIDRVGKHEYSVWDYKTGGDYMFKGRFFLKGGRLIQHALYSLAAQRLLRKKVDPKAKIVEAGYLFPGERTAGRLVRLRQDRRGPVAAVLARLFKILRAGTFVATKNKDDCGYCDFTEVCRSENARAEIKLKLENESNETLDPLRELADYG